MFQHVINSFQVLAWMKTNNNVFISNTDLCQMLAKYMFTLLVKHKNSHKSFICKYLMLAVILPLSLWHVCNRPDKTILNNTA